MTDTFLDKIYDATGTDETRDLYARWSASYDAEVAANGYATPARCAEALKAASSDLSAPILDFGCGTGLSGLALSLAGFTTIDGMDLTREMLEKASEKQVYRALELSHPDLPFTVTQGDYAAIAAIGVIGAGAAPLSVFDMLVGALGSGGLFVLSFNDHTLEDPDYDAKVAQVQNTGEMRLIFEEYGDHLPGKDMRSKVYVLEKT